MRAIIALVMMIFLTPVLSFAVENEEGFGIKPDTFYDRTPPDKNFVDMPELTRTGRNLAKKLQAEEGFDISLEEAEQFVAYAGRSEHQAYILTLFHLSAAKGNPEWKGNGMSGILAVDDDQAPEIGGQCGLLSYEDMLKIGNNVCAADRIVTEIINDGKKDIYRKGFTRKFVPKYGYQEHVLVLESLYNFSWTSQQKAYERFKEYQKIGALIKE